jgi:dUTP pyrophosphatase
MKLNVLRMYDDVKMPVYATDGSGCFDIYGYEVTNSDNRTATYGTGLKFEIPEAHVMLVFSRSGDGFKKDIRLANCVGVIDSDYRGELGVKLTYDSPWRIDDLSGQRIAQAIVLPYKQVEFVDVSALSVTARGEGGFGSTNGS